MDAILRRRLTGAAAALAPLLFLACGGGGSTATPAPSGQVNLSISDAATEDWAVIGVKLLRIGLVPAGGGAPVTVYTAPSPAPTLNLVQLDQLSEILGNVPVPAGTYAKAVLTLAANPGDVYLTSAANPSTGFAGMPSTTYGQPPGTGQVQIQHATGTTGNRTVSVTVDLAQDLVVTAGGSNALDLEFDLSHPAFIVDHTSMADGSTIWAVNFARPMLRHRRTPAGFLVLRQLYGTVAAVAADASAMTLQKDYPAWPIANPETPVASGQSLAVLADATNGTLFYDLDSSPVTPATVHDFSGLATLLAANSAAGKATYVRLVIRLQAGGTLVAARVYASTSVNTVFANPEGHVLHVAGSGTTPSFVVENESGQGVQVNVTPATNFFFRTPAGATAGVDPISGSGGGVAFMNAGLLARGFKVHATVDPATTTALDVDIEIAKYQGVISGADGTGFDTTSRFRTLTDNYTDFRLPYVDASTPNGIDPATGAAYAGFKWWNLGYPTLINPGSSASVTAIQSFVGAVGGSVAFGGSPAITAVPFGVSYATWNGGSVPAGWNALSTILVPTPLPAGTVATGWTAASGSFTMTVPNGTQAATVELGTAALSAPLVYQVDRSAGVVTVSQVDLTTSAGQAAAAAGLVPGSRVKVFGVPQADAALKAYVVFYYTGSTLAP